MIARDRIKVVESIVPKLFPWITDRLDYSDRPNLLGGWVFSFTDLIPGMRNLGGKSVIDLLERVSGNIYRLDDRVDYIQGYQFVSKGTGRKIFYAVLTIEGCYYTLLSQEDKYGHCHILDIVFHRNECDQDFFLGIIEQESHIRPKPLLYYEHRQCNMQSSLSMKAKKFEECI